MHLSIFPSNKPGLKAYQVPGTMQGAELQMKTNKRPHYQRNPIPVEEKVGETNGYHMMDTAETGLHTRGEERGLLLTGEEQRHEEVIPDWAT